MKAVDLYINSMLPPDLQDTSRPLDKKNLDKLMAEVALKYPDQYPDIVRHLADTGRRAAYLQGETLGLEDFQPVVDKASMLARMDAETAQSDAVSRNPQEREQNRLGIWSRYSDEMGASTSLNSRHTGLGRSISSGARGNPIQLKAMLTTPALYTDYKGKPIPMFIRHSFSEGLRPSEHLASAFGTRASVISTKASTAKGGDLLKQMVSAAIPLVVTTEDCGTSNGLDYGIDDASLYGRVLAREYDGLPAGTVIDKHVISKLRKNGTKTVIARSPMTCTAKKGICAHCLGTLPTGHFATKGYSAGVTSAQGLGEPVVQGALNCLASGTMVRMGDGGIRAIEWLRPGDVVLGADRSGDTFPVKVNHLFYQGKQPVFSYMFDVGDSKPMRYLTATANHRILVKSPDRKAMFMTNVGDMQQPAGVALLDYHNGRSMLPYSGKMLVQNPAGYQPCWDIEVDSEDSLFVLENGMVVHNSKHTGGATKGSKKQFSGFDVINQIVQSPEEFPNRATVAETSGRVSSVTDAPQGGKFIQVGEHKHYTLPGFDALVKPGDEVEAGDPLSDGIIDASDIVRLRGLGEGRRYYADRLGQALEESGAGKPSKLNLEMMARAAIDHVKIDDPDGMGNHLPDDVVSYGTLANSHVMPGSAQLLAPAKAHGKYLHAPALHYTIGTQLTPKMAQRLKDADVKGVIVSDEAPKFHPEMVRLRSSSHSNPDWLARMQSSYLSSNLADAAERSLDTNVNSNVHYAPRLASGKDFGKNIETTGEF